MRVCPKCQYIDPLYWKQSAFRPNISFTRAEELAIDKPKLVEALKDERYSCDGFYAYRLTKFGNVERQAILENPDWRKQWYIPTEKPKSNLPDNMHRATMVNKSRREKLQQRKLLEVTP